MWVYEAPPSLSPHVCVYTLLYCINIDVCMYISQLSTIVKRTLENNNLKKERFTLAHSFRGFSSWSVGSIVLGPRLRENILMGSTWLGKGTHIRSQEVKATERGQDSDATFKGTTSVTQLASSRTCLLNSVLPQAEDQSFNIWGILKIQTIAVHIYKNMYMIYQNNVLEMPDIVSCTKIQP